MDSKSKMKYRKLFDSEYGKDIPLFIRPWYLDAVAGEDWDVILVEKGGEVVGALPIYMRKKFGFRVIVIPPLTQHMGPYIKYPKGQKYYRRLSWEKEIINKILDCLPGYDFMSINLYHGITNCLPFMWRGFDCRVRYTYVIEKDRILEDIIKEMEVDVRRRLRRAEERGVEVVESEDVEGFYEINRETFLRKGMEIPYGIEVVSKIYKFGRKRGACKILFAVDSEGKRLGAGFFAKDDRSYYYLMSGITEEGRRLGAMDVILMKGISMALEEGFNFDFEGSIVEEIEKFFRSFGARQKIYFNVSKENSIIFSSANLVRNIMVEVLSKIKRR